MTVLVFDIGATRIRMALASEDELGPVVRMETDPTVSGFDRVLDAMQELAQGHRIAAVVGGTPGQLEGEKGRLVLAPNLPEWVGVPVLERLKARFECPVLVLNDVVLGGLGECHFGAGKPRGIMAYFTVSTGLNAVRIVEGKVDATIDRYEIGHHILETESGEVETFESLVGGAAMEKRLGRKPREVRDPEIWRTEERHLARGLYNVILDWAPDVVVFGGSMMRDINLTNLGVELRKLPEIMPSWPILKRATLKDTAGLLGGVKYWEQTADRS